MGVLRWATSIASPGAGRGKLLTFFFHRVLEVSDPMIPGEIEVRRFDAALQWISQQFRVLQPLQACEQLAAGTLPSRAAIISFDDGYRDNHDTAMPVLLRHRMSAVFFIATGYLGDGVQFNDRLTEAFRALREDSFDARWLDLGILPTHSMEARLATMHQVREALKYLEPQARTEAVERVETLCATNGRGLQRGRVMMSAQEVRALAANGMEIGGHTVTHPILQSVDDAVAYAEIESGRSALTAIVGRPPMLFAYPNGKRGRDFDARHAQMARRAGFRFAFSTQRGVATRASDPLQLPRFMPWNTDALRFKLQALRVVAER